MARPAGRKKTVLVSMRITPETAELWTKLAEELGVSKVAVFEMAVRKMCKDGVVGIEKADASLRVREHPIS